MTFQYYNNNGTEANIDEVLRLDNQSVCKKAYEFYGLFERTVLKKIKFITENFSVISSKKIGQNYYILGKNIRGVRTYYTATTSDNCEGTAIDISTKPLDYVIFVKEFDVNGVANENWRIDSVLRDLYICYTTTGQSVDCEKLRTKNLPRGYYFRKDATTNEVERIFVTGNPQDLILTENVTGVASGFDDIYNSELIKSIRQNIDDNKEVYLLIGVLIILSATIYFIRRSK